MDKEMDKEMEMELKREGKKKKKIFGSTAEDGSVGKHLGESLNLWHFQSG